MTDLSAITREHYQAGIADPDALVTKFEALVAAMDEGRPKAAQLAGLDQFHVGGLAATAAFATRLNIGPSMRVLDAGCGLGGPARYLAETFGCQVVGVDLTPAYVAIANMLTTRAGLTDKVSIQVGDLTDLPFDDAGFDLVWTQHVVMNIADRGAVYGGFRRVLKSGGQLAFYDALAADGKAEVYYPTPWAQSAATSTLLTEAETRDSLAQAGFAVMRWDDVSQEARTWAGQQPSPAIPGGGPGLVVGPRIGDMVANFQRNLAEGRVRLVMGVLNAV